jgi:hypothetical protein
MTLDYQGQRSAYGLYKRLNTKAVLKIKISKIFRKKQG